MADKLMFMIQVEYDDSCEADESITSAFSIPENSILALGEKFYNKGMEDNSSSFSSALMDFMKDNTLSGGELMLLATIGAEDLFSNYARRKAVLDLAERIKKGENSDSEDDE